MYRTHPAGIKIEIKNDERGRKNSFFPLRRLEMLKIDQKLHVQEKKVNGHKKMTYFYYNFETRP